MITFEHHIRELIRNGKITSEVGNAFLGVKEPAPEARSKPDPLEKKPTLNVNTGGMGGLTSLANKIKKGS
jgi:hypothetical protein